MIVFAIMAELVDALASEASLGILSISSSLIDRKIMGM